MSRLVTALVAVLLAAPLGVGATASREGLIVFERDYSIYLIKPDGSGLRVLAKRGQPDPGGEGDGYLIYPSFTPDGSRVTYVNGLRTTHQSVVVSRVAGGTPRRFPVDGYLLVSPLSFAPTGAAAVVSRFGDTSDEIATFISSTRSGKERQLTLTSAKTKETRPDWSPDGRSIVFARLRGRSATLTVVPATGGAERLLVRGWEPDWAPSGEKIAFVRRDGVYTCRRDGGGVRRLVAAGDPTSPDYSPDGTRIAYAAGGALWVVRADGGPPTKVAARVTGDLDWG